MTKTSASTYQNFFGQNRIENFEEIDLILTEQVCRQMAETKMCGDHPLFCENGIRKSNVKLEKSFSYLEHRKFEVINCLLEERFITADFKDERLFGSLTCKAFDGSCALSSSFIVWDPKAADRYSLTYITSTNTTKVEGNFLVSDDDNYIFNIIDRLKVQTCGNIEFYKTNQDLFITLDENALNLPKPQDDFIDINKIKLAEEDMLNYKNYESQRHLAYEICITLKNMLRIASLKENKFFSILDSKENEIILYSTQNQVFLVKCFKLINTSIIFMESDSNQDLCEPHLTVNFTFINRNFTAYLDYNNILRPLSKK
jgi:hypothetical protein